MLAVSAQLSYVLVMNVNQQTRARSIENWTLQDSCPNRSIIEKLRGVLWLR